MISRDIMELRFERPAGFNFLAGQFVRFMVPSEGASVFRPYSLSSAPQQADYLEFCAKILPDGKASKYFLILNEGDSVSISQAQGVFVCQPRHVARKMFIGTGAGVAPIMSMIAGQLSVSTEKIELLFGVRNPQDVFWTDRLDELAMSYSNFKYQLTLSRPHDSWKGLRGRVSDHLTHISFSAEYYICGSVAMVKDVRSLLIIKGVDTKSIHCEIF